MPGEVIVLILLAFMPVPGNPIVRNRVGRCIVLALSQTFRIKLAKTEDHRRRIPGERKRCLLVYLRLGAYEPRLWVSS